MTAPQLISSPEDYRDCLNAIVVRARPDLADGLRADIFDPFTRFLRLCGPGYCPTIRMDLLGRTDALLFANAFDAAKVAQGHPERAVLVEDRRSDGTQAATIPPHPRPEQLR